MPDSTSPHILLEWARDLAETYSFLDFHVHPFDVLTGTIGYQNNQQTGGLYSIGTSVYHPPVPEGNVESPSGRPRLGPSAQRAFVLASRFTYTHTGQKVFADQINLAGLAGALFLPVARLPGVAGEMLDAFDRMFAEDKRLLPGCAFPIGIPPEELACFFRLARETRKIRAIKIHPNLAGLDPLEKTGRELIEASLVAAGSLDLPVVVHGGRTPALESADAEEYGTLRRLATVNWSLSSAPVIFAHGGLYGLPDEEAIAALPILENLFEKHSNLMADTSNLESFALRLILKKTDRNRLIFGSDALYVPIWKAWVRFLQALRQISPCPEDDLIRIASLNPARCLDPIGHLA